ncbi:prolactin regulatory element-binding protein [Harmonia axyridis]|uniref:prolactin regulatory element-binding protein n=1 Tax=Harmonia axyridis TaxID=115357 RepID=UPI001E277104|nr:prolactin regulatory element-binding protein [Harmonia axyridis]
MGNRKNREDILARVNFPLYAVQMLSNRHVIVGGGGGSSKTGVANGFEIFEISHNGRIFLAEEVTRHETGPSVVMNFSTFKNGKHTFIVAGQENHCQLYSVDSVIIKEDVVNAGSENGLELRERKPKSKLKTDNNKNSKKLKFVIKPSDSVQSDFSGEEPLLRVIRIHPSGQLLATGGTDCQVRLWKFPKLEPTKVLQGHTKEIDDMDFSSLNNHLITIAKDGLAIVWDCVKAKEITKLKWQQPEGSKYLFKRCRFGKIEDTDSCAVYTLSNPTGLAKKQKSFLQKWIPESGELINVCTFDESLSALAVRDDGRFVAVGSMFSGSVSIHASFSLQKVLNVPGAHSMFVTGLEFLPVNSDLTTVTSNAEAAVLSISVDNHLCIHTLNYRKTIPVWFAIVILVAAIFLTFILCSYLGI